MVLKKTLESPLDCKEIQPVCPQRDQSWEFIRRTDAEAETPVLWPLHAKMGTIKDRNGMDLTEAKDIQKRWQEYPSMGFSRQEYWSGVPLPSLQEYTELYKKDLHDPDNHDGVITHLEPDILECKVKWALGSITTN